MSCVHCLFPVRWHKQNKTSNGTIPSKTKLTRTQTFLRKVLDEEIFCGFLKRRTWVSEWVDDSDCLPFFHPPISLSCGQVEYWCALTKQRLRTKVKAWAILHNAASGADWVTGSCPVALVPFGSLRCFCTTEGKLLVRTFSLLLRAGVAEVSAQDQGWPFYERNDRPERSAFSCLLRLGPPQCH